MPTVLATQLSRLPALEAARPPSERPAKPQAGRAAAPEAAVAVTVSQAMRDQLERAQVVRDATDALLAENGRDIYDAAFRDLKQYPESLAAKLDDPTLSEQERTEIANAMIEREQAAYGVYTAGGPLYDPIKWAQAYIEYYDSLSPEDQMSDRYRGTREQVVAIYQSWTRDQGEPAADLSKMQNPILRLFEALEVVGFEVEDPDAFRSRYEALLEPLYASETNGERFQEKGAAILDRLDGVLAMLDAARAGDGVALRHLEALAADPASLDGFLDYAQSLQASDVA